MHEKRADGAERPILPPDPDIPNNQALPVLLHRGAVPAGDPAAAERLFARHGWPPAWRNGIHPWQHFHADAHEALAIVRGQVRVQLGGAGGPVLDLGAGDVVALPAGVGHCNLGASPDLLVVGAYPAGTEPSTQRATTDPVAHARSVARVAATADPKTEPVGGGAWPQG